MAPPIWRSLILWLGLPGFGFILWAWHDSSIWQTNYHSSRNIDGQIATPFNVTHGESKIYSYWPKVALGNGGWQNQGTWTFSRVRLTYRESLLPAPAYHEWPCDPTIHGSRVSSCLLEIPHWLVLMVYLTLWVGLAFWRQRHIRRRQGPAVLG